MNVQDLHSMSDEEFWDYARQRACSKAEPSSFTEYLECKLSDKACLIALQDLLEVLAPPYRLARLPGMPEWMAGIMAWRGETIAVVNLDCYLSHTHGEGFARAVDGMLLIVGQEQRVFGFLVPLLGSTITVEREQIIFPSDSIPLADTGYNGLIEGMYMDSPVLRVSSLLAVMVQQIEMAAHHG